MRYEVAGCERASVTFRRSLYVVRDSAAGEGVTPENIRSIRPGHGLAPKYWTDVIDRRAARALKRGDPLAMEMIDWHTKGETA